MTLTDSGMRCDVCGQYILLEYAKVFKVTGIEGSLHCHKKCKQVFIDCGKDWRLLPDGPLRDAFQSADKESAVLEDSL